ncbi:alkylation response protein AidB-like acyl-CoA dehydrogenase [Lipingzhangella halophila]|uniref:Alkylation response protein AidB-like acyl-CoA dehydrogenase n=1 Tax=Lipingzhangella halophila TaxID=1783352 RepID=A0A7W7W6X6_9ACTN|nr:acyl-CoA dehydrogenase family protein [Lipingzhangella halophila]MBB4935295.1 alkylation response protein AidB-like acyl-CoA dehydrogenase [Lipingzhangella halophila]
MTGTLPQARTAIGDSDRYLALHEAVDEPASDALLDDRERHVRSEVRDVVATEVAPRAAEVDRSETFAGESFQALARAGWVGLLFSAEYGGTGDSTVAYAAAMEEITAGCAATSMIFMTQTHAGYPIVLGGDRALVHTHVPPLLTGAAYGSLAITEPNAGSDVSSLRTTARAEAGGDYRISGSKTFITTGDRSNVIVCFATTDRTAQRGGVTAFVLDGASPGVGRGAPLAKMGLHGSTTAELFLDDVPVPASNRLGEPGSGWDIMLRAVAKSRISAAAQGVGFARGAYAHALAHLRERHGKRLPQAAAFELADLRGRILQARLLLLATAREVDRADAPPTAQVAVAKQRCTDLGFSVARAATRLLGGAGDLRDLGVERYVRDAKAAQIYDGTNEIQRLLIARDTDRRLDSLEGRTP